MKNWKWFVLFCVLSLGVGSGAALGHGGKKPKKIGILLVAFGSSEASAQVSFENIDKKVKERYVGIPVRWAFTSHMIRKKMAARGKILDSPAVALAKMMEEGFTHVAVQSLHTIAGAEFHDLRRTIGGFAQIKGFRRIILGNPLLATQEDIERTVSAILKTVPKVRKPEEAVILMGHGSHHPSNAFYSALAYQVQLQDANIFVGTVEGYPEIDLIVEQLKRRNIQKAYLMPLMSVAGDHAKNDMAGDETDSWKSILTKENIQCVPILKGMAEYDDFIDIWVSYIQDALHRF